MTLVMGILNVTPDSFSDGGLWDRPDAAVAKGLELAAAGADFVDVGGESTRPGAERVAAEEERRRVLPVIEALVAAGVRVSVDTMRAEHESWRDRSRQLITNLHGEIEGLGGKVRRPPRP